MQYNYTIVHLRTTLRRNPSTGAAVRGKQLFTLTSKQKQLLAQCIEMGN